MAKATGLKTVTLSLVLISSAVSGCVSGYVEGTDEYIKFCVERQPVPSSPRCPKGHPGGDGAVLP